MASKKIEFIQYKSDINIITTFSKSCFNLCVALTSFILTGIIGVYLGVVETTNENYGIILCFAVLLILLFAKLGVSAFRLLDTVVDNAINEQE